jgi:hypothetical protein
MIIITSRMLRYAPRFHGKISKNISKKHFRIFFFPIFFPFFFGYRCSASNLESACKGSDREEMERLRDFDNNVPWSMDKIGNCTAVATEKIFFFET